MYQKAANEATQKAAKMSSSSQISIQHTLAPPELAITRACGVNQGVACGRKNVKRRCTRGRSLEARATSVGVDAAAVVALSLAATPAWQDPGENGRPL